MSDTSVQTAGDEARPSSLRVRRRVLAVAGVVLAAAIVVLITLLAISTSSNGEVSVLIGTLGSEGLAGLALIAALVSVTVGLCLIPAPRRRWLLVLIPARLAAISGSCLAVFAWLLTSGATVTPLLSAGCETGYVVEEQSFLLAGWGTVYRTHGILVTAVEQTTGDDGYHPFHDVAYAVVDDGDTLQVWYKISFDPYAAPVSIDGAPAFILPKLTDRTLSCGLSIDARSPQPTLSPPPEYDLPDAQASITDMLGASLAAAAGPVVDSQGMPVDPQAITPVVTACDDGRTRAGVALEFAMTDNADSLTRILGVWDAAGYASDRARQEDIRYSDTLPIEKMSIRDSTSIDGLIRMQISSQCSTTQH